MRLTTSCAVTVKIILYPYRSRMKCGRAQEELARRELATELKKEIKSCGLFIDYEYPYLGASPDGLIEK